MRFLTKFLTAMFLVAALPQTAAAQDFSSWLENVKKEAREKEIPEQTISTAFANVQFLPVVIKLDRKQPEGVLTFAQYQKGNLTPGRIEKGRELLQRHSAQLKKANTCGVPPEIILALWAMESNYGSFSGRYDVISALATLAYDGRRSSFFRTELFDALEILEQGHIDRSKMKGSWAGAMGQNQFMPSSFQKFAVDGNDDGKKDIWHSLPDIFASTANHLCMNGWQGGQRWGREVKLSQNLPDSLMGLASDPRSLAEWSHMGVKLPDGNALPTVSPDMKASLVRPKHSSRVFLVYNNYRVIMNWNKSVYFATSVGMLADRIAQPD